MKRLSLKEVKVSPDKRILATQADVDAEAKKLKARFPEGYAEYVTKLGQGVLCDLVRVYLPDQIQKQLKPWRQRIKQYWFWDDQPQLLTQKQAQKCIVIGDSVIGDELVFHPDHPDQLFVLSRESEGVLAAGSNVWEAVEWMCGSGKLVPRMKRRYFEPQLQQESTSPAKKPTKDKADAKPLPGELLSSQTRYGADSQILCVAWFLKPEHRQETWDGVSPPECDLPAIVRGAQAWGQGKSKKPPKVREVSIKPWWRKAGDYWAVTVTLARGDKTEDVMLDLDGRVIEPEVRRFRTDKECQKYLESIQEG
jgi:hypothetical protein